MFQPITLVMADDNDVYRDGFATAVSKFKEVQLLSLACNGRELIEQVKLHRPDIVFIDIKMPVMDGIEACRELEKLYPHTGKIVLTMYNEKWLMQEMLQAGARGFLLKNAKPAEILDCIKKVHSGGTDFCADSTPIIHALLTGQTNRNRFTETETRILKMICREMDTSQIAKELFLSIHSINMYRKTLLQKCQAKNMAGLVMYAVRNGIVEV